MSLLFIVFAPLTLCLNVFPVANDSLIWSLQALNPILKINGYNENGQEFKNKNVFGSEFDFVTIKDVQNLALNQLTCETLENSICVISKRLNFTFTIRTIPEETNEKGSLPNNSIFVGENLSIDKVKTNSSISNKWHIYLVKQADRNASGGVKILQVSFVNFNESSYYSLLFTNENYFPIPTNSEITPNLSSLCCQYQKSLCFMMMIIEELNSKATSNLKTIDSKSVRDAQSAEEITFGSIQLKSFARLITPVSYYRGMIGFLVLLIDPVNTANLYHSLKIPSKPIKEGIEKIIIFLTEYYYMTSTDNLTLFQHENQEIIQTAKTIVNQLVKSEFSEIFPTFYKNQPNLTDSHLRFSAIIQALVRRPRLINTVIKASSTPRASSNIYELLQTIIKFHLKESDNTLRPVDLMPLYSIMKQKEDPLSYLVDLLVSDAEVNSLFTFKSKSYFFCSKCKHFDIASEESSSYLSLGTLVKGPNQKVKFSEIVQEFFYPYPVTSR